MKCIIIFTQNLKLESLQRFADFIASKEENVFLTTHFLFENERAYISKFFPNCTFVSFADFLTDSDMAKCDVESYVENISYTEYLKQIKKRKNICVYNKVTELYGNSRKFIFSDDLGIDFSVWHKNGYKRLYGEYYYHEKSKISLREKLSQNSTLKAIYRTIIPQKRKANMYNPNEVSVGFYEGKKYVFIGKMHRIDYRLNIQFNNSEEECNKLNNGIYETKDKCTYMTTWHEHGKCKIPDEMCYAVRWAQDGYLPPNYTHYDYDFKPNNVVYYCWDVLGTKLFKNRNLPYEMIPFRKKLYIPKPVFPKEVKNILVVASGSGDWTALKNRSDDDIMVDAFVQMAKRFPNIHFTYRCHPTWVHPLNVGVNSINRVNEYFKWLSLPNLTLSSNMPLANQEEFQFSFSRSSLDDDLNKTDIVFGEHSISMIDAAFRGIPFCSVNLTNRRNFFVGINDLGFPSCTSHEDIAERICNFNTDVYKTGYLAAVDAYNRMTDAEEM